MSLCSSADPVLDPVEAEEADASKREAGTGSEVLATGSTAQAAKASERAHTLNRSCVLRIAPSMLSSRLCGMLVWIGAHNQQVTSNWQGGRAERGFRIVPLYGAERWV